MLDNLTDRHINFLKTNLPKLEKLNGIPIQEFLDEIQENATPSETLLNCIDVLIKEKERNYSIRDNIDAELKTKMKELIQTIS